MSESVLKTIPEPNQGMVSDQKGSELDIGVAAGQGLEEELGEGLEEEPVKGLGEEPGEALEEVPEQALVEVLGVD